ncbi:unnamed protein product [Ectocarpus sp. 12 AP-2014]
MYIARMYVYPANCTNAHSRHTGRNQDQTSGWLRVVLIGQRSNFV